jgi:hypothetical protein
MDESRAVTTAQRWKALFYVRLAVFAVYGVILYLGLTSPDSSGEDTLVVAIMWLLGGLIYLFTIRTVVMTLVLAGVLLLFVNDVAEIQSEADLLPDAPIAFALIVPALVVVGVLIDVLLLFAFAVWKGARERRARQT